MKAPTPELILRHAYFDEAGLANPLDEPYTVVAGVVVHVDDQYQAIRKYLLDMADDLVGKRPPGFFFHAMDLWHGEGFFPRPDRAQKGERGWELAERLKILGHLADIPAKFELPIIYSCIKRAPYLGELPAAKGPRRRTIREANRKTHSVCYVICLDQLERWMVHSYDGEQVFIVLENHTDHREKLLAFTQFLSDPRAQAVIEADNGIGWHLLKHVVEDPLFVKKSGMSPIQIADTCAFVLARSLADCEHSAPLLEKMKPNLVSGFIRSFVNDGSAEQSA